MYLLLRHVTFVIIYYDLTTHDQMVCLSMNRQYIVIIFTFVNKILSIVVDELKQTLVGNVTALHSPYEANN
jgi:hypothetical protein